MPSDSHKHAVLLVDDDADPREAIAFYLRSLGWEVAEAESGMDALRQLYAGLVPCAVILDAVMPEMSGFELLTLMRSLPHLAAIPTIMVSGHPEQAGHALRLGVRAYLTKPADLDVIEAAVAEHCRRSDDAPPVA